MAAIPAAPGRDWRTWPAALRTSAAFGAIAAVVLIAGIVSGALAYARQVQTGLVLGCALSEVSSVLGIVLALVWNYHYFFLWLALGTLGILINFPRKSSLDAAAAPPK